MVESVVRGWSWDDAFFWRTLCCHSACWCRPQVVIGDQIRNACRVADLEFPEFGPCLPTYKRRY